MTFAGMFIAYIGYALFYYGIENLTGNKMTFSQATGLPAQVKFAGQTN